MASPEESFSLLRDGVKALVLRITHRAETLETGGVEVVWGRGGAKMVTRGGTRVPSKRALREYHKGNKSRT